MVFHYGSTTYCNAKWPLVNVIAASFKTVGSNAAYILITISVRAPLMTSKQIMTLCNLIERRRHHDLIDAVSRKNMR